MKRNYRLRDYNIFALLCWRIRVIPSSFLEVCTLKNFLRALPYLAEVKVADVIFLMDPVISF